MGLGEMPPWWTPWSRLSWWRRLLRAGAILVFVYHVAAMFLMGASPAVRKAAKEPIFSFYADKMRMTNTWGMFSKRPSSMHVRIEAVDRDGEVTVLSTTESKDKGPIERFRDARLRKIQTKLASQKDRDSFGNQYLDGWCRTEGKKIPGVREVRARQIIHELRDDRGKRTRKAEEKIVLRRSCGAGRTFSLPVKADGDGDDGGDDP